MSGSIQLRRSWLVQRLRKPYGGQLGGVLESLSFGGGLRNGGLSSDAMDLLRGVFSFDYMGAAEFEWGAVPKALEGLAKSRDLVAFSFGIPLSVVPPNWRERKNARVPDGEATLYVICRKSQRLEVRDRIADWACGQERLKERTGLPSALRPCTEWQSDTCGWLELDNGFFFFTSREMWEQTAALFGVKVPAVKS